MCIRCCPRWCLEEHGFVRRVMDVGLGVMPFFSQPRCPPPALPAFLPGKALVEQSQDFRDVELHVFQVEVFLVIFLHLQQIVKLQIQFQQSTRPT
jgi:hypothetical protein